MTITFLDPRQGASSGAFVPAVRLESLTNKRLGLLWNNKVGGDVLLKHVADILNKKYNLADIYFTKKMFIGNAAPPEVVDDLASRVDAVIVGVGD